MLIVSIISQNYILIIKLLVVLKILRYILYSLGFYLKKLKFDRYFDYIINLQDYLLPKASKKTTIYLLKKFNVKPPEVIYIDDKSENLKEAKKMGVKIIHYQNFKQFFKKFDSYLK